MCPAVLSMRQFLFCPLSFAIWAIAARSSRIPSHDARADVRRPSLYESRLRMVVAAVPPEQSVLIPEGAERDIDLSTFSEKAQGALLDELDSTIGAGLDDHVLDSGVMGAPATHSRGSCIHPELVPGGATSTAAQDRRTLSTA